MTDTTFAHGRFANGLRKVEITDNFGRTATLHISGRGTLAEAMSDTIRVLSGDWDDMTADISPLSRDYWTKITSFVARCGDEIWEYYARH